MKELTIISGKGGTGKTSVVSAFAAILGGEGSESGTAVYADCDVDAADLHLIFDPDIAERHEFVSGYEARIDAGRCVGCGKCETLCRFDAVRRLAAGSYGISGCEGCGACVDRCPAGAIEFSERLCGEWYRSDTRFGPLVHAALNAGAENSGKLVTMVRKAAREEAERRGADFIIVDGCPGIGCPVIASITGADAVLAVVEPSLSSAHDLDRVIELTKHFKVPLAVAVNKFDINPEIADRIRRKCEAEKIPMVGSIGYDTTMTAAQIHGQSVIEFAGTSTTAEQIRSIWKELTEELWKP